MAIFNSYVKLPEGNQRAQSKCGASMIPDAIFQLRGESVDALVEHPLSTAGTYAFWTAAVGLWNLWNNGVRLG